MTEAGISAARSEILYVSSEQTHLAPDVTSLHAHLRKLRPKVIVALGPEAAHALVSEWPDGRDRDGLVHRGNIRSATDAENRRGYIFDSSVSGVDASVIVSLHPAFVARNWTPWRMLLSFDLQRAQEISRLERIRRPQRQVEIVTTHSQSRSALAYLRRFNRLSADLENRGDLSVACIGFAGESGKSVVFPAQFLDVAGELLRSPGLTTTWVNGIYDLFILKHRNGWEIPGRVDDAMILWHACYPELAGARESKTKHRFTRKSLSFLASLSTYDAWWKNYAYAADEDQFILNGRDCCITLDVWDFVAKEAERVGAWETYEHERSLMWPCVDMLARGLRVDNALRLTRIAALDAACAEEVTKAEEVLLPLLEREKARLEDLGVLHLFQETEKTCECCRHATNKQAWCWSCAGFDKAPSKKMLLEKFPEADPKAKKEELAEQWLGPCRVCGGAPRETRWTVNVNSNTQMCVLLYDVLKLPKKFKRNTKGASTVTADEQAMKTLLGGLSEAV